MSKLTHALHPQSLPLAPTWSYNPHKQQWELKLGFMLLAKFSQKQRARDRVVYCYCFDCLRERGDPFKHDLHVLKAEKFAAAIMGMYPSIAAEMTKWAGRFK